MDDKITQLDAVRRKEKRKRLMKRLIGILLLVVLALVVLFNYENLAPENLIYFIKEQFVLGGKGEGFPVDFEGSHVEGAALISGNLALLTDSSFVMVNDTGKQVVKKQHSYLQPVMRSNGRRALIYDVGGKKLRVDSHVENTYEKELNQTIVTGDIGPDGSVLYVTNSDTDQAEMTVLDKNKKEIFKWYSAEYKVLDACLSSDLHHAAVSLVSAQGGQIKSLVYVFDFSEDKPVFTGEYPGTLFLSLRYKSSDTLLAIGNNKAVSIHPNSEKKTEYSYDSQQLVAFYNDNTQGAALCFENTGATRNTRLVTLSANAVKEGETTVEGEIRRLYQNEGSVYALSSKGISRIGRDGTVTARTALEQDDALWVLGRGDTAYVVALNEIRAYPLK